MRASMTTREHERLDEALRGKKKWKRWGTYLSERQWGTVREDYSENGDAWGYLPFDHAHLRAYRWGEDGLLGYSDHRGLFCFRLALWNGQDPILKERLFGLSGPEGNHGEDVKEVYHYEDATPTCSYARGLYKYPQRAFPYDLLRRENGRRSRDEPELDLVDTGIFDDDRYWDVRVEYAKVDAEDVLVRITVTNRGPERAELSVLPTFLCRNTWSFGTPEEHPRLQREGAPPGSTATADHFLFGRIDVAIEGPEEVWFVENESNKEALWRVHSDTSYPKDGFGRALVHGERERVSIDHGSVMCGVFHVSLAPGASRVLRARFRLGALERPFDGFDDTFEERRAEADAFYDAVLPDGLSPGERKVARTAYAGLLWTRQFYHLDVNRWLRGDPGQPEPPAARLSGRNHTWSHLYNSEVISMPDKWEYPWYAAWDTVFHALPLTHVDPDFAKAQIMLFLREWYMHPNGQIPAYEWAFSDVNPPVQAWAAIKVYRMDAEKTGRPDTQWLASVFHKLMLNFTWWVNRKDAEGHNVFEGGFMGLDNIGVFDRSAAIPEGGRIEQADATSWMGMYCLDLLQIALELAKTEPAYEDVANKFCEHFFYIAHAASASRRAGGVGLWDERDAFFYDVLFLEGRRIPLRVRSIVGIVPMFAVEVLQPEVIGALPNFVRRMKWFLTNRPEVAAAVGHIGDFDPDKPQLLSLVSKDQLRKILERMLDETEFLAPHGIRALSKFHAENPYVFTLGGREHRVEYEPAESRSAMFGGNSNWRGPIWFPMNYLIIDSLMDYHSFFGDDFQVECPRGSGRMMSLRDVAMELARRLVSLFLRDGAGRVPSLGDHAKWQEDPHFKDNLLFYEYFHGETGAGLGASHQTGWTALVISLLFARLGQPT